MQDSSKQSKITDEAIQPSVLASRFLENALIFTLLAHFTAMASMALLLLPGMPGGNPASERIAYLANNPFLWRLAWLPWHLTALSDLILAIALIRTSWIPRYGAFFVLLTSLAAILVEQPMEFAWSFVGVNLAQAAVESGEQAPFLQFEAIVYPLVAGIAASLYAISACGWSWTFAKAKVWSPSLTWLSWATWGILLAASLSVLLPPESRPNHEIIAIGNALGFVLMQLWFVGVTELVLRRSRPNSITGRMAQWQHPQTNLFAQLLNIIAESRFLRALGELLPSIAFKSNISNVIYVNYLVEAKRLKPLVPWGLELQTLGKDAKYALFTHLTYQHGHFGPRLLGPLRALMPSPVQSNWRIYVYDPETKQQGIYFVTTAINQTLPALLARILSEGLPMHLLQKGEIVAESDESFHVQLVPASGSAPDLLMKLEAATEPILTTPWEDCFENFRHLLAYCVPQDRGMSSQVWYSRITRQEIDIPISLDACEALRGSVISQAAEHIVGDSQAICFRVPSVSFLFKREEYDYRKAL